MGHRCAFFDTSLTVDKQFVNFCAKGNVGKVRMLLRQSANVDATDEKGKTGLCYAVDNYNVRLVKLLLKYGAAVDDRDQCYDKSWSFSSLYAPMIHHAARSAAGVSIVPLLVEHKANINITDSGGYTALMYACMQDAPCERMIQRLLECKADANMANIVHKRNALIHYVKNSDGKLISQSTLDLLISHTKNINHMTSSKETVLEFALHRKDFRYKPSAADIVKTLLAHGAKLQSCTRCRSLFCKTPSTLVFKAIKMSSLLVMCAVLEHCVMTEGVVIYAGQMLEHCDKQRVVDRARIMNILRYCTGFLNWTKDCGYALRHNPQTMVLQLSRLHWRLPDEERDFVENYFSVLSTRKWLVKHQLFHSLPVAFCHRATALTRVWSIARNATTPTPESAPLATTPPEILHELLYQMLLEYVYRTS